MMDQTDQPRCGRCWAPLRRDSATDEWVNDEPLSKPVCMGNGPHEPMDDLTLQVWNRVNRAPVVFRPTAE